MTDVLQVNPAVRDAERIIVTAILNNHIRADECDLTGLEFTNAEYQKIVLAALDLTQDGSLVDFITLSNYLATHKGDYKEITPNPTVLAGLAQMELPANIQPSIGLVQSNKARADLLTLASNLKEWTKDYTEHPTNIIDRTADVLDRVRGIVGRKATNYKHLSEIAPAVRKEYDDFLAGVSNNIPIGIPDIDNITSGGGAAGDLWVIGAPSGQGKSSLMLAFARSQAQLGYPVLVITREMLEVENYKRLHSAIADVPVYLMRPNLRESRYDKLISTMDEVSAHPIFIDATSSDLKSIKQSIKTAVEKDGVKAVYVDYLQLIKSSKTAQRAEEVAEVSRSLKEFAMDNKIWICALAQYNRAAIVSGDIQNHSFSESSQIEKDASVILHLELEKVEKGARIPLWRRATIYMGKGRNSPNAFVELWFRGETFEFKMETPDNAY